MSGFDEIYTGLVEAHGPLMNALDVAVARRCALLLSVESDDAAEMVRNATAASALRSMLPAKAAPSTLDLTKVSDDDLDTLEKIIARASGEPAPVEITPVPAPEPSRRRLLADDLVARLDAIDASGLPPTEGACLEIRNDISMLLFPAVVPSTLWPPYALPPAEKVEAEPVRAGRDRRFT